MKLNLGAGSDVIEGWVNHDIAELPGISVVHDLNIRPWPWKDGSVDEIKAYDVLEHLDHFLVSMEEIWRILSPKGRLSLSVPYYNSWCAAADPTHKRGFHELTFQFFDPDSVYCKERPYYTKARFRIVKETFVLSPFSPYLSVPGLSERQVSGKYKKKIIGLIGNYFISNLILDLRYVLEKC
ncbi:methyltransferase domain-containing protein [Leptospira fluminis]|uniref:Methyltransferase domain-containing protein n=1 Tax=Leptospira fluminis TaxID=2484979 RepID=A0A4V3JEB3_9LEPT|nr:methyltransferase domain-containing protein [Leptospira fluminis]TGK17275.1 methyltransferase domain-containing protein [Leptospira fluminis]